MKTKILLITLALVVILGTCISFATEINMETEYTAEQLNTLIIELHQEYPKLTEIEIIGNSNLGTPIYALRVIGNNIKDTYDSKKRKQEGINNYFIMGGVHARETVNPQLLIKQAKYYLDNGGIDENVVIHYLPLVNPDGYNLSLHNIGKPAGDYKLWKANIKGTDINRNFPSFYYSPSTNEWVDFWGRNDKKQFTATEPGPRYYFGEYPGSAIETQNIMAYMNKYSFNLMLDYHSQGEIIYWEMWFMPKEYEVYNKKIADLIYSINGYTPYINTNDQHGSGYSTDYFATVQYAPALTVETTKARNLPFVSSKERLKAFSVNKNVTLEVIKYNEKNKPNGLGEIPLYTINGERYGNYPKKLVYGYAERYSIYEKDQLMRYYVKNIKKTVWFSFLKNKIETQYNPIFY